MLETLIEAAGVGSSESMIENCSSGMSGIYDARSSDDESESEVDSDEDIENITFGHSYQSEQVEFESEQSWDHQAVLEDITKNLLANSQEFVRLELDDHIEDPCSLIEAIHTNTTVRDVEVHIEALEGLSKIEQASLAGAICSLPKLRNLLVYKNSTVFLEPLHRYGPWLLENLRLCKLDICEQVGIDLLGSALESLPSLRSLDIGFDSNDSDKILDALRRIQPTYVSLECFRVDCKGQEAGNNDNMLDERIVIHLAETIRTSRKLKTLALPPYSCSDKCYKVLTAMLEDNSVIERIDYWIRVCNLYYPDANETIDHYLHLNQSGVRQLEESSSSPEIWDILIANSDDLDVLYHLFSANPSFVSLLQT